MFTPESREEMAEQLASMPRDARSFVINLLTEHLLAGSLPEEHKVDVRIMKAHKALDELLGDCLHGFAQPIPPHGGRKATQPEYLSCQKTVPGMAGVDEIRTGKFPCCNTHSEDRSRVSEGSGRNALA